MLHSFLRRFQLTPPRRGRLRPGEGLGPAHRFNSRPREEGDVTVHRFILLDIVSTHAPAKRATCGNGFLPDLGKVSTHAPAKRATRLTGPIITFRSFNSRPREEGDQRQGRRSHEVDGFNSRPREEGDIRTHRSVCGSAGFNSRPREEGDKIDQPVFPDELVSTHAPAKRATLIR